MYCSLHCPSSQGQSRVKAHWLLIPRLGPVQAVRKPGLLGHFGLIYYSCCARAATNHDKGRASHMQLRLRAAETIDGKAGAGHATDSLGSEHARPITP